MSARLTRVVVRRERERRGVQHAMESLGVDLHLESARLISCCMHAGVRRRCRLSPSLTHSRYASHKHTRCATADATHTLALACLRPLPSSPSPCTAFIDAIAAACLCPPPAPMDDAATLSFVHHPASGGERCPPLPLLSTGSWHRMPINGG